MLKSTNIIRRLRYNCNTWSHTYALLSGASEHNNSLRYKNLLLLPSSNLREILFLKIYKTRSLTSFTMIISYSVETTIVTFAVSSWTVHTELVKMCHLIATLLVYAVRQSRFVRLIDLLCCMQPDEKNKKYPHTPSLPSEAFEEKRKWDVQIFVCPLHALDLSCSSAHCNDNKCDIDADAWCNCARKKMDN